MGRCAGFKGLRSIFGSISKDALGLKIMVSLVSYYTRLAEIPVMSVISSCEYPIFNLQSFSAGVQPRALNQIFLHYLGQISSIKVKDRQEILKLLITVL
jgi:hypothetical protein